MKYVRIVLFSIGVLALINVILVSSVSNLYLPMAIQALISVTAIVYSFLIKKIPRIIHIIAGVICFIPLSFAVFLFVYGHSGNASYQEDVIIVLGAGVIGETVSVPLAQRLDKAVEYLIENPDALVVVCGGLGDRAIISEAEAMARYLVSHGVSRGKIILEDKSTSTYENLLYAKEILDEIFPDGFSAVLATSDYHIFRSVHLAGRVGFSANRTGAGSSLFTVPISYLREILAIINMLLFPPWSAT